MISPASPAAAIIITGFILYLRAASREAANSRSAVLSIEAAPEGVRATSVESVIVAAADSISPAEAALSGPISSDVREEARFFIKNE